MTFKELNVGDLFIRNNNLFIKTTTISDVYLQGGNCVLIYSADRQMHRGAVCWLRDDVQINENLSRFLLQKIV